MDNGQDVIDITVKQTTLLRRIFLGRVRISMVEVAAAGPDGTQQSYRLLNENLQFDDIYRYVGSSFKGDIRFYYDYCYNIIIIIVILTLYFIICLYTVVCCMSILLSVLSYVYIR